MEKPLINCRTTAAARKRPITVCTPQQQRELLQQRRLRKPNGTHHHNGIPVLATIGRRPLRLPSSGSGSGSDHQQQQQQQQNKGFGKFQSNNSQTDNTKNTNNFTSNKIDNTMRRETTEGSSGGFGFGGGGEVLQIPHTEMRATTSRIQAESSKRQPQPTTTTNKKFSHISKTATNLLNDIYEKNLLNQTQFPPQPQVASRLPILHSSFGHIQNNNNSDHHHQQQQHHHHQMYKMINENLNDYQPNYQHQLQIQFHQSSTPSTSKNHHHDQQQQLHATFMPNPQQQQQQQHFNYECQKMYHPQHQQQQQHNQGFNPELMAMENGDAVQPANRNMMTMMMMNRKRFPPPHQKYQKPVNNNNNATHQNSNRQMNFLSGRTDENIFISGTGQSGGGINCSLVHHLTGQQQQQQQQQQQHYNYQTRTRADGENCNREYLPPPLPHQQPQQPMNFSGFGTILNTDRNFTHNNSTNIYGSCNITANKHESTIMVSSSEAVPQTQGTTIIPSSSSSLVQIHTEMMRDDEQQQSHNQYNLVATSNTTATTKFQYRNSKIDLMQETAQAMAAAEYYARAAQKMVETGVTKKRTADLSLSSIRNGGFCGALQRAPPPLPSNLARRLANKENYGLGKVKVMLRVSNVHADEETPHFMSVDKKKRQVTLTDPTTVINVTAATSTTLHQDRGPMVAAPKMFAFDGIFTADDQQMDVCASALSEVIPAVLEGSDGCLLTIGYPNTGQSRTMFGSLNMSNNELGAVPCAISWLYKGINERRQKSGSRFSVRVSALGISATKPDSTAKDLLAAHATESDESPGIYLRDDFLGGPTELRAPTAERAALFLDAALAGRPHSDLEPATIFTLHVYQYSLSRKGGVAGGRSRLHIIDLGGCANRHGGLPLSGIGNILLAILSGQRHPPNKDHPLTPLLKDCLAPIKCHVSILAHVSYTQAHTDALTTIQLASRIHRMRRRKHRFPIAQNDKNLGVGNAVHLSGGSSEGPDPSSSDLSADTVIYMGPCDDATDGEHPPVYLPSMSSGDNRCAMSKALKGSGSEKQPKTPVKKSTTPKPQSTPRSSRTNSLKRPTISTNSGNHSTNPTDSPIFMQQCESPSKVMPPVSTTKIVAGLLRHTGINKSSNCPSPKSSPLRRPAVSNASNSSSISGLPESPMKRISEEQWIDGPRLSRAKVAEARHLLREINHVKHCETWVDGPTASALPIKQPTAQTQIPTQQQKSTRQQQLTNSLINGNLVTTANTTNTGQPTTTTTTTAPQGYGFMDSHKKIMIRQWVENQSSHIFQPSSDQPVLPNQTPQAKQHLRELTYQMAQQANTNNPTNKKSDDDQLSAGSHNEMVNPIGPGLINFMMYNPNLNATAESCVRSGLQSSQLLKSMETDSCELLIDQLNQLHDIQSGSPRDDEEDQDSGPSEVPPPLPLLTPLGSREISHESLHRIMSRNVSHESIAMQNASNSAMMDCGLQVSEDEIARTMGGHHPLAALSNGDMSVVSSFNIGDAFSDCAMGERTRNQFDQLARLREIFTSQLAMAEVTPTFRTGYAGSVYSEPAFRLNIGGESICSEPVHHRPPSPRCGSCRQSLNASRTSSQTSLPSLNGIMQIAGMEQYASLRHPDGASDPNLPKNDKLTDTMDNDDNIIHQPINNITSATNITTSSTAATTTPLNTINTEQFHEKSSLLMMKQRSQLYDGEDRNQICDLPIISQVQLPLLQLNTTSTCEAYDSGHDSSTPRTSKHSGISRRAESGYHSVATARDSDESSLTSASVVRDHQQRNTRITVKKKRQDRSLCNWLRNPFTCTHPETEGEISDF